MILAFLKSLLYYATVMKPVTQLRFPKQYFYSPERLEQDRKLRKLWKQRRVEIEQAYLDHATLEEAGKAMGITRERVRQVVRKSVNPKVRAAYVLRKNIHRPEFHAGKPCRYCQRIFGKDAKYASEGVCQGCNNAKRRGKLESYLARLPLLTTPTCITCLLPFDQMTKWRRKRNKGMCMLCYSRTPQRYSYTRKWMRKFTRKQTTEREERVRGYARAYYWKNRERLLALRKTPAYREKLAANQRRRYADPVFRERALKQSRSYYYKRRLAAIKENYEQTNS